MVVERGVMRNVQNVFGRGGQLVLNACASMGPTIFNRTAAAMMLRRRLKKNRRAVVSCGISKSRKQAPKTGAKCP